MVVEGTGSDNPDPGAIDTALLVFPFESIVVRKIRRSRLTEDENVEIKGRDLRKGSAAGAERPSEPPMPYQSQAGSSRW